MKKNLVLCYFWMEHLALKKVKPFLILSVNEQLCVSAAASATGNRNSGVTEERTEGAHLNLSG